ncbi:MAG TPA: 6-pyruvoyl tetrahydrobiopterin synthase [Bacteroidales bacterium]|nr:6-pyruvoyl tetrahydrobiopterin synthase [Bacteroidales bacterium]
MIYLTRRERFSAAHRLCRSDWSNEKNAEIFGQCSNPNWHGHNYVMYVTVKGEIDPETGFVINLKELSQLIKKLIIDKLDHKNLNLEVDFLKDKIISTEVIVVSVWDILAPEVAKLNANLHCIKVEETENNFIEYYGN